MNKVFSQLELCHVHFQLSDFTIFGNRTKNALYQTEKMYTENGPIVFTPYDARLCHL